MRDGPSGQGGRGDFFPSRGNWGRGLVALTGVMLVGVDVNMVWMTSLTWTGVGKVVDMDDLTIEEMFLTKIKHKRNSSVGNEQVEQQLVVGSIDPSNHEVVAVLSHQPASTI
ncbi:hypothetical protein Fmac_024775 [Flemingia macrophylla]|uniref:Uncharacterized protein n=1 Tax=Flemingia macrophylla TaxID=520843 RepID=A0ABD1LQB5_9FABA